MEEARKPVLELSYADYQKRQLAETQPERLLARAANIHFGNKFRFQDGQWLPVPYPGFALLSMLDNHPANAALTATLVDLQQTLIAETGLENKLFPLPKASFHQTIANALSDHAFEKHILQTGLEPEYAQRLGMAIAKFPPAEESAPVAMRLLGLSLFGSALGILGIFDRPTDFGRILDFREHFYSHPDVMALGVRRTRPFIGHITLLYFGEDIQAADGARLARECAALNEEIGRREWVFQVQTAQLKRYPHLADFYSQPSFPKYSFVKP